MKILKMLAGLVSVSLPCNAVYVSEVINHTRKNVSLVYPTKVDVKIVTCKSIETGDAGACNLVKRYDGLAIDIPAKTLVSLKGAMVPEARDNYSRSGITIGFGTNLQPLTTNHPEGTYGLFAFIRKRNNRIEAIFKDKFKWFGDNNFISVSEALNSDNYMLEITEPDNLKVIQHSQDIIDLYSNPGKILPQELLHQAVVNDSVGDIKTAVRLGANINVGIADQPPLLMALLMKKDNAVKELLSQGASPNIVYNQKPVFLYLIRQWDVKHALALLDKGVVLLEVEKQDAIDSIMFRSPHDIDQDFIEVLKRLNYSIKDNFDSVELAKNKWYKVLAQYSRASWNNAIPSRYSGLPRRNLVELFLKNGANPNQVFTLLDGRSWTPLLLIIDSYIQAHNLKNINEGHYQIETGELLKVMIAAGASINQRANPLSQGLEQCPLSYAITGDELGYVVDFLTVKGAALADGIDLFLKSGGNPRKELRSLKKVGKFDLLWWVVDNNNPRAVQLLVDAGLKNNARNVGDDSPLNLAIKRGYSEIIKILMAN